MPPSDLYIGRSPETIAPAALFGAKKEKSHGRIPQREQPWLFHIQQCLSFQRRRKSRSFAPYMSGGMCVSPSGLNHISVAPLILGAI